MNKRNPTTILDEITRFDPNNYWKEFNLKGIHSFYLDIKSIKNLKRELPLILTTPLDCIFERMIFPANGCQGSFMNASFKNSEISTIHISGSKGEKENNSSSFENSLVAKKKETCVIF